MLSNLFGEAVSRRNALAMALALLALCGCGRRSMNGATTNTTQLTGEQVQRIMAKRVFFGHQSVGDNVVQGLRALMAADRRLQLKIIDGERAPGAGPMLVQFHIGNNGDPASKDASFAAFLNRGIGDEPALAMYKYCYVDVTSSSDVPAMFQHYRENVAALKAKYPSLTMVHVTVPLTVGNLGLKATIKSALGRTTERDVNAKRNQFNDLMRREYAGREPIFDLAAAESTHLDGSRSSLQHRGQIIYTLAPEFSDDGGHLNELGRRVVALKLLNTLAEI